VTNGVWGDLTGARQAAEAELPRPKWPSAESTSCHVMYKEVVGTPGILRQPLANALAGSDVVLAESRAGLTACRIGAPPMQAGPALPGVCRPSGRQPLRSVLGELASLALPNAGDVPTSAFWESARPGVAIAATPSVRSGPDALESRESERPR